jgi:cyclic beta-1,2-glucan synthetase
MDHGFPHRLTQAAPALLRRSFGPDGLGRASRDGFGRSSRATPWDGQDPIREELFSAGRLDDHARSLAAAQPVMPGPSRRPSWTRPRWLLGADDLSSRLADNGAVLLTCYQSIMKVVEDGRSITPAAEWLIDNYHLVERQVRAIRLDLPPGYYQQLPKLASGPFAGAPRVLGLAWAYVAHTDSRFDAEGLVRTVRAYQEVQPLTIGELWAVSITLRTVLIENLRRLAQRTVHNCVARQAADAVADRLLGRSGHPAEPLADVAAGQGDARLPEAFAVQLVHRLRDQDGTTFPALAWLDENLAAQGTTADAAVRDVHRRRGTANVTVRNIITSLRLIQDVDWNDLFESMSLVDDVLVAGSGLAPAAGTGFAAMDFPTRNLYRGAIEQLARGSGQTELDVAHAAVLAAQEAQEAQPPEDARRADPGYVLLGRGRRGFESSIGYRLPWLSGQAWLCRPLDGIGAYAGAILVAAVLLLALALAAVAACGLGGARLVLLGVLGAIDAATALVNRAVASACHPKLLPGMEMRDGVPLPLRTLVAVPMLLTTVGEIAEAVEHLEIHYLASPEGELHFALLSDWTDAPDEHAAGDSALLAAATAGIARLNQHYGPAPGGARFLLLHRRRAWSAGEARWMGWERKRGKLHELNRLLRGAADTSFMDAGGSPPPCQPESATS